MNRQRLRLYAFGLMLVVLLLAACAAPPTPTLIPPIATAVPSTPTAIPPTATLPPPTGTPTVPTATLPPPTGTPTALVVNPPCPEWFAFPEPGKGVLVLENHVGLDNMLDAGPPLNWSKLLPAKKDEVPGRLVLQLLPGSYVFNDHTIPARLKGRLTLTIKAGELWISPIYLNTFEEVLLPLDVPPGCK